ncbi:MAG: hypothetical protein O7C98_02065, partial [Planctomycetota bacterium]|nr:hypothetical protein [Planctomycetota bacterium]
GQTVFSLGESVFNTGKVRAWVNGVEQVEGTDFLVTTAPVPGVAFTGAPGAGATVLVTYNGGAPIIEVGGRGYEAEFLVFDRAVIPSAKNLTFDPLIDGVLPGTTDLTRINTSLYNPSSNPGKTVGALAFGTGKDGPLSVPLNGLKVLDTGDMPNALLGKPFTVTDLNPTNQWNKNVPPGPLTYDSTVPTEFDFTTVTVPNNATLEIIGVNPVLILSVGLVQITGTITARGQNGTQGPSGGTAGGGTNLGGAGGPGGFRGGTGKDGIVSRNPGTGQCSEFQGFLDANTSAKNGFPFTQPGEGPGRGMAGGEMYSIYYSQHGTFGAPPTGGGGGSHGGVGEAGEDRHNATGATGTSGPACTSSCTTAPGCQGRFSVKNSGVIGIRGQPGALYGDREIADVIAGGSGGGAGGTRHHYTGATFGGAVGGGSGGGGGGSIAIYAGDSICFGGKLDVRGGDGGGGTFNTRNNWHLPNGSGGGGSGGNIALISATGIEVTGGSDALDTTGGAGGARPNPPGTCTGCNAGGDGGMGIIFLMDPDGVVDGLAPGIGFQNGPQIEYSTVAFGLLTISEFVSGGRFAPTVMYTELFSVGAANPTFTNMSPGDFVAESFAGQDLVFFVSGTRVDPDDPLLPDFAVEIAEFRIATIENNLGTPVTTINTPLGMLNGSDGTPERDEFMRARIDFLYDDPVQSAVGPLMTCDRIRFPFELNGP